MTKNEMENKAVDNKDVAALIARIDALARMLSAAETQIFKLEEQVSRLIQAVPSAGVK